MSISDFGAWYGVQSPTTIPVVITLEASGHFDSNNWGSPQSITLPSAYSTVTNDCIIVAFAVSGTTTPTFSGCGATWNTYVVGTNPVSGFAVGYGCTSGGTTISVASIGTAAGSSILSVWAGLKSSSNPVTANVTGTASSAATVTTSSLSYSVGQLLVGMGGTVGGATFDNGVAPTTWSIGTSNNFVALDNSQRPSRMDYIKPLSGSSTTLTENTTGSVATLDAVALALNHA